MVTTLVTSPRFLRWRSRGARSILLHHVIHATRIVRYLRSFCDKLIVFDAQLFRFSNFEFSILYVGIDLVTFCNFQFSTLGSLMSTPTSKQMVPTGGLQSRVGRDRDADQRYVEKRRLRRTQKRYSSSESYVQIPHNDASVDSVPCFLFYTFRQILDDVLC